MHVIGYIKNALDYGITYSCNHDINPLAFVNTDYGGCRDTHQLTSGYVFMMTGGVVTGSSKWQATVALSTVKVEYVTMSQCTQQMVWMQNWLDEAEVECMHPGIIKGDSHGVIALMKHTQDHGKVKHIDIWHHYIHDLIWSGAIIIEQVPSSDNLANVFAKPLTHDHHHQILLSLNIQ